MVEEMMNAGAKSEQTGKSIGGGAWAALQSTAYVVAIIGVISAAIFVFYFRLGDGPIRQWDEASLAVNSVEMLIRGEWFAKYMGGVLDYTDTKPPLANWLIAACMKLFGANAFALRLPSATAALLTVLTVFVFCHSVLKNRLAAIAASLVLITSVGFTGEHVARGGDYDSLLVLFVTIFALSAYEYGQRRLPAAVVIGAAALSLALLTKGVAALLPVPGVLLYLAHRRETRGLIFKPITVIAVLLAFAPLAFVYLVTEAMQPGYLSAVNANELWGRFGNLVKGGTPRGPFYYLIDIARYRFAPWILILPFCVLQRNPFQRFGIIFVSTYLVIISISQTKFHWYDAPIYPIASLCVGLVIADAIQRLRAAPRIYAALGFGMFFIVAAYKNVGVELVRNHLTYRENDQAIADLGGRYAHFLKSAQAHGIGGPDAKISVINDVRYNTPMLFWTVVAEANGMGRFHLNWETASGVVPRDSRYVISCSREADARLLVDGGKMKEAFSDEYCRMFERLG